jgi:RNA polymerase sigma factor (sigma-70 family)
MAEVDVTISLNDLQLVRTALIDPRVEDRIFRRVYPKIFEIVRFAVKDRRQAEDIAQLAAIKVLKSLHSFGGLGSIESWAQRIAYRTAMRSIKRRSQKDVTIFPFTEKDLSNPETPEELVSRRQLFDLLLSQMERIPAKRRIPILLHLACGYTVSEVSQITEASMNTVKARLKVGFRELRTILNENPSLRATMLEDTP